MKKILSAAFLSVIFLLFSVPAHADNSAFYGTYTETEDGGDTFVVELGGDESRKCEGDEEDGYMYIPLEGMTANYQCGNNNVAIVIDNRKITVTEDDPGSTEVWSVIFSKNYNSFRFSGRYESDEETETYSGKGKKIGGGISMTCIANKLKTTGKLCKSYFKCYAKSLKKKTYDIDTCNDKAWHKFMAAWEKLELKSAAKEEDCETVGDTVMEDIVAIAVDDMYTQIYEGINADDKNAVKLAGALLKATEKLADALIKAQSANIKKPNDAKLQAANAKAEAKFTAFWEKAFKKAQKKGIDYTGPSANDIKTITDTMVSDILEGM